MSQSQIADLLARYPNPQNSQLKFGSMEAFVLHHGRDFVYQPLPNRFKRGRLKQCFANSYAWFRKAFLKRWKPGLTYVEGYAMSSRLPVPVLHAWCVYEGCSEVLELTNDTFRHYYGIPFRSEYVMERTGGLPGIGVSLIDDWKNGYPLLQLESLDGLMHN